ncbi:MAG: hypothetical protein OEZ22_09225 [Spirochaetia bacterium]|nr:hypothetical protein [Spirochaetia bacterium]
MKFWSSKKQELKDLINKKLVKKENIKTDTVKIEKQAKLAAIPEKKQKVTKTAIAKTKEKKSTERKVRKEVKSLSVKEKIDMYLKKGPKCWSWQGPITGDGYGQIWAGPNYVIKAHRAIYEREIKELKVEERLKNKCGNKKCVNPKHWEVIKKKIYIRKGPARLRGQLNGMAVLTPKDIRKIRSSYPKKNYAKLAREFNVSASQITRIIKRVCWTDID